MTRPPDPEIAYDHTLQTLLDKHAPSVTEQVSQRQSEAWYDSKCRVQSVPLAIWSVSTVVCRQRILESECLACTVHDTENISIRIQMCILLAVSR